MIYFFLENEFPVMSSLSRHIPTLLTTNLPAAWWDYLFSPSRLWAYLDLIAHKMCAAVSYAVSMDTIEICKWESTKLKWVLQPGREYKGDVIQRLRGNNRDEERRGERPYKHALHLWLEALCGINRMLTSPVVCSLLSVCLRPVSYVVFVATCETSGHLLFSLCQTTNTFVVVIVVGFSHLALSDYLQPVGQLPCPPLFPGVCSCPSSQWCHPTISSPVVPFSCSQSFPASGAFPMSRLFKVLELQPQHQSFQWIFRFDFL